MERKLLYLIFFLMGLVVLFLLGNVFLVSKKGKASRWISRGLYISGILCVLINAVRMVLIYDDSRGIFLFSNAVALVCIIAAFVRSEHGQKEGED